VDFGDKEIRDTMALKRRNLLDLSSHLRFWELGKTADFPIVNPSLIYSHNVDLTCFIFIKEGWA